MNQISASLKAVSNGFVTRVAIRYPDLMIVTWLLEGAELYIYFWARMSTVLIPLALYGLSRRMTPHLQSLSRNEDSAELQAAAARINLGYLMVCGAMALIVLESATYLEGFVYTSPPDPSVLIWLVVGQSAPVIFGATSLLMHVAATKIMNDFLYVLTASLFVFTILYSGTGSALVVAQALAAAQLSHAAICAVLLTRSGIWPGLTALFHKEIKLF